MTGSAAPDPLRFAAIRSLLLVLIAAASFAGALRLGERARDIRIDAAAELPLISKLPDQRTVRLMTLGYENFAADLLWLQVLQQHDIGSSGRAGEHDVMVQLLDNILALDPDFKTVYRFAGTSMIFVGGSITRDNVLAANRYLMRAMQRYPDDYYYPYTIGLNWAFYMPGGDTPEVKANNIRQAIDFLQIALQKPGVPRGTPLLIAGLMDYHEDRAVILDYLEQAYVSEPDPTVRAKIERRIDALAGGDQRQTLQRQRRKLDDWQRANFDYLPPGLAYHVGERLVPDAAPASR